MQSNYLKPINVRTNIKTVLDCGTYVQQIRIPNNQSIHNNFCSATSFIPAKIAEYIFRTAASIC